MTVTAIEIETGIETAIAIETETVIEIVTEETDGGIVIETVISTGIGSAEEMIAIEIVMYGANVTETLTEIATNPEEEQLFSSTEQMDTAGRIS